MRRIPWPAVFECAGALLLIGTMLYLAVAEAPSTTWALLVIGVAFALWLVALFHPSRREAQPWERSAQVAFLVLALGQVGTVASSRRAQLATEQRIAEEQKASDDRTRRADSLAEMRQHRTDSLAWVRDVRADSLVAAREGREAAAQRAAARRQREAQQAAELTETRRQLAAADDEMRIRLRTLTDSIGVQVMVTARRRTGADYDRATRAFAAFLKPRDREGPGLESARTYDLVSFVARVVGDAETHQALRCIEGIASRNSNRTTLYSGVWTNWGSPDTMSVGWGNEDPDDHIVTVVHRPVADVVRDLTCTRWMLAVGRR